MTTDQQDNKVVINGKEHLLSEFNDQQKYYVAQLKNLTERENSIKFDLDQVVVAKQSFTDFLVKSLEEQTVEEVSS